MKITYEFNYSPESADYLDMQLFQNAQKMFSSLIELDDYTHKLRKEHINDNKEKILETISDIIYDSGIGDIGWER